MYRRLNTFPNLLADGVGGNPDHTSAADLHAAAWPLADAAIRRYEQLRGTGRMADTIAEVVLRYEGHLQRQLTQTLHELDAVKTCGPRTRPHRRRPWT